MIAGIHELKYVKKSYFSTIDSGRQSAEVQVAEDLTNDSYVELLFLSSRRRQDFMMDGIGRSFLQSAVELSSYSLLVFMAFCIK